jgi:tellurite resistance protein TerC
VYTGFKFFKGQNEEETNIEDMAILKWLRKHMRITPQMHGNKFFVRQNGMLWATPLFLVLILVEASDVIFAVDSIPAIFAVTSDPFIVLTANLMAILGLRAMFFLLSGAATKMHYLPYGLGIILVFIGFKMLMLDVFHMPIWISLDFTVVLIILRADINPSRATIARFAIFVSRFAQFKMPVLVAVVLVIVNILL